MRTCWLGAQAEDRVFLKGPRRRPRREADWGPQGGSGATEHKHPDPRSEREPAHWRETEKRSEYSGLQQLHAQLGVPQTLAGF